MNVPNLRSPYARTCGLIYFPRMLDKIRLHLSGALPEEYRANLGTAFDERCVLFFGVGYESLLERMKRGGTDEDLFEWCCEHGRRPTDEQIEVWSEFIRKRGWNDAGSARLDQRKIESGFEVRDDIQTFFDYIDADEGRPTGGAGA